MGNRSPRRTATDKSIEVSTRTPKPQKPETIDSGVGEGGASIDQAKLECWDFTLVDLQATAKLADNGAKVYGLARASRLIVAGATLGPLGFAPSEVAEKMRRAASRRKGEFKGEILSIGKGGDKISVRLCLT